MDIFFHSKCTSHFLRSQTSACSLKYPYESQKGHYPSFAVRKTKAQRE